MKLTQEEIELSFLIDEEGVDSDTVDDTKFRTRLQRKELRNSRKHEDGELVGSGSHSYRKY